MNNKRLVINILPPPQRNISLDIIRAVAIVCVIAGHFFSLNTEFRSVPYHGELSMFIQGMANFLFEIGVPLFIMLTGYLNFKKKNYSWKYVYGMKKVLLSYLFFSVITVVFRKLYLYEGLSWLKMSTKILDFSAIPYAWYIEMWIGLYLLTPFLNRAYDAFGNEKKQKRWILGVLTVLTALPYLTNRYGLYLLPEFWKDIYPILFFFIGRFIQEYRPQLNWVFLIVLILIICALNPALSTVFANGHTMLNPIGNCFCLPGVVVAVAVFLLLLRIRDIKYGWLRKFVTRISIVSLEIYLCCYISDQLLYPWFKDHFFINQCQYGKYFFMIVPCLVIFSYLMAEAKGLLFHLCAKISSPKYCS